MGLLEDAFSAKSSRSRSQSRTYDSMGRPESIAGSEIENLLAAALNVPSPHPQRSVPPSPASDEAELKQALEELRRTKERLDQREARIKIAIKSREAAAPKQLAVLRERLDALQIRESTGDSGGGDGGARTALSAKENAITAVTEEPDDYDPDVASPPPLGRATVKRRETFRRAVGTIVSVARPQKADLTAIERELQRKKAEQESTRWMIDPEGRERALWDITAAFFVFYLSVVAPSRLGFSSSSISGVAMAVDVLADLSRFVDIGVNFRTGFMDAEQHLVLSPSLVREEYLYSWFALDLLLSVPFMLLGDLSAAGSSARTAFYALAMLRIFPTARRAQLVARLGAVVDVTVARILVLFATFMYLMHIMACSYWAVVRHQEDEEDDAWLPRRALLTDEATYLDRYSQAIHWALLVTVNGFITKAFNREEAEFTAAMYVLGSFTYATIIASTTSLVANLDAAAVAQRDHTARLNAKMQYNKIHPALQDDIREYYEYCWAIGSETQDEDMFSVLPESLHRKLIAFLAIDFVQQCSFFENFSSKALVAVLEVIEPCIFLSGDDIVREGDEGTDMFFIKRGDVRLHLQSGLEIGVITVGQFFGELCLLPELKQVRRTATCTADTVVECLRLTREAFEAVVEEYPEVRGELRRIAEGRLKQHSNVRKLEQSGKLKAPGGPMVKRMTKYEKAIGAEDPAFAEVLEAAERIQSGEWGTGPRRNSKPSPHTVLRKGSSATKPPSSETETETETETEKNDEKKEEVDLDDENVVDALLGETGPLPSSPVKTQLSRRPPRSPDGSPLRSSASGSPLRSSAPGSPLRLSGSFSPLRSSALRASGAFGEPTADELLEAAVDRELASKLHGTPGRSGRQLKGTTPTRGARQLRRAQAAGSPNSASQLKRLYPDM